VVVVPSCLVATASGGSLEHAAIVCHDGILGGGGWQSFGFS